MLSAPTFELRLVHALQACERLLAAGMHARYAIASAATLHAVDPYEVAVRAFEKHLACEQARAAEAAMAASDHAIEHATDAKKAITPRSNP